MSSVRNIELESKSQASEEISALDSELKRMITIKAHYENFTKALTNRVFSFGWNPKLAALTASMANFDEFIKNLASNSKIRLGKPQLEEALTLFNSLILSIQDILSHRMDDDVINILLKSMSLIIELNKDLIKAKLDISDRRFQNDLNQGSKEDLKSELEKNRVAILDLKIENAGLDGQAKILQADKDRLDTFRSNALTTTGIVKGLATMLPDRIETSFMTVQPNGDSRITFDQIREHVKAEATKSQQEIIKALDAIIMPKPSFFNKPANDKIMGEAGNASSIPSPSPAENK